MKSLNLTERQQVFTVESESLSRTLVKSIFLYKSIVDSKQKDEIIQLRKYDLEEKGHQSTEM